ncbi:ribonuclease Z [Laceyella putida]|uniref:Ribonuclease Z n=1 Tax=Laceyella putida TaxID=110101 RepID=A0ABW2RH95_9BACL
MELLFLGTGAGIPSKQRNVSALALIMPEYKGETWLFDCGEATQHQILDHPIRLGKVSRIFITHLHGDHIYGLPGVLGSRSFQGAETPLTLYGPKGLRTFVEVTMETSCTYLRYPLTIKEVEDGDVIEEDHFTVTVKKLDHGIPCYGYRLQEKDQPGALDAQKLKALQIPPGPLYQEIKQGKTVTLPDGRVIDGKEFIHPPKPGRILAILGDTRPTPAAGILAQDADLLVHESTYGAGQEDLANAHHHSTCVQAATLAKEANAKALILTHISSRFMQEDHAQLLAEAQSVFRRTHIAHDGFRYQV